MSKYYVVQTLRGEVQVGPEEGDVETVTDVRLVLCEDSRAVHRAIVEVQGADGGDWAVFETVGKRAVSRAVSFKMDGKVSYDVEIS